MPYSFTVLQTLDLRLVPDPRDPPGAVVKAAAERIEMGPKDDTFPVPSAAVTTTEAQRIKELGEHFPGWDIHRVFGGWEAIPKGMAVVRGVYLDSIEEKLEVLEARLSGDSAASDQPGQVIPGPARP